VADIKVLDLSGRQVGDMSLRDDIFNVTPNKDLLFRYIDMQLANRRQGTACTKTRAEVSGTGKKPFPQKHTGRARQGTLRGPHQRHGGVAFGPKPRDWSKKLNKKMKRDALKSALSVRFQEGNLIVLEDLTMKAPKTKELKGIMDTFELTGLKTLFVLPYKKMAYENVLKSGKNLPKTKVIIADNPGLPEGEVCIDGLNVFDIINHEKLILTKGMVTKIEEVLGNVR